MKSCVSFLCMLIFFAVQGTPPLSPVSIYINPSASAVAQGGQSVMTTTITHQPLLQTIKPNISLLYELISGYVREHRLFLVGTSILVLYCALFAFLLNEHHALQASYYWSTWCKYEDFGQMASQPHELLRSQLIKEIARYYINPDNPTDPLWPLTHFMNAIKKEEIRLKRYIYITSFVRKTPLVRILPTLQDSYAQNLLVHVQFVYHIFTAWSSDLTWDMLTNSRRETKI